MVILTKSKLHEFVVDNPNAENALDDWYRKTRDADWSCFLDVKQSFNSVDYAGNDRYVFDSKGNHYRLVAMIFFNRRTLYIRFIGSHSDYDLIDCSTI